VFVVPRNQDVIWLHSLNGKDRSANGIKRNWISLLGGQYSMQKHNMDRQSWQNHDGKPHVLSTHKIDQVKTTVL